MTATSTHKTPAKPAKRVGAVRVSTKARDAIELMVTEGATQREAAKRVDMNEKAFSRALKKPHVAAYLETRTAKFVSEMNGLKGLAKSLAIREGMKLLREAKSEAVKARMVEFFASDPRTASPVQVNLQQNFTPDGYVFRPPGMQVVEIAPEDSQSPTDDGQGPEK